MSYEVFRRRIDTARQILVGAVPSPAGQIDQITYALMYKFMNDRDDQSASLPGGQRTYFTGEYAKYNWHELMKLGGHDQLALYRQALESMGKNDNIPELFRSIYQNAFLPFNSPNVLHMFLKEIDKFDHGDSDDIGDAYEYLLSITGAQGDVGQFRTPRHIIKFITKAVNPTKDDKVLDPACGTAGFLIAAYNHVKEQHDGKDEVGNTNDEHRLTADEKKKIFHNYRGFDIDPTMVRTAKVNMYLHGFPTPDIINHDSLSNEDYWDDWYDVILANPPFMSPKGGIQPHKKFSISASRAEVLFVDYIVSHLKPNGRAGIVVPDGILTRTDSKNYTQLRKYLTENGLWAVIDLPRGIFEPYSKVKTSILLIDKQHSTNAIAFMQLRAVQGNDHMEVDQDTVLNIDESLGKLLDFKNGSITAGLIPVKKEEVTTSRNATLAASNYIEEATNRSGYVALGDILERVSRKVGNNNHDIPVMSITMREGLIDQGEKFKKRIATADVSNYKLVHRNELVVGFPIDEGVLGFQMKHDSAAVSPAYDVWRLKSSDIPIAYLEKILRSEKAIKIYKKNIKGTANRRRVVPKEIFLKIKIPIPDTDSPIYDELSKVLDRQTKIKEEMLDTRLKLDEIISRAWEEEA